MRKDTEVLGDTGYQGIQKRHASSRIPRKKKCGIGLSREDKRYNHALASERISVEHVIGRLKRFRIELSPNVGDGLRVQAAAVWDFEDAGLAATSIPSVNLTP